jgi:hypothetical protein
MDGRHFRYLGYKSAAQAKEIVARECNLEKSDIVIEPYNEEESVLCHIAVMTGMFAKLGSVYADRFRS